MSTHRVELGTVVIDAANTPVKGPGEMLIPKPRWRYKGASCTIELSYQVGRHDWAGFAGDSPVVKETINQPVSVVLAEFEPPQPLKGVPLTGLKTATDDIYDMEMWFRSSMFSDERGIFKGCCKVPAVTATLEIVSCSFS